MQCLFFSRILAILCSYRNRKKWKQPNRSKKQNWNRTCFEICFELVLITHTFRCVVINLITYSVNLSGPDSRMCINMSKRCVQTRVAVNDKNSVQTLQYKTIESLNQLCRMIYGQMEVQIIIIIIVIEFSGKFNSAHSCWCGNVKWNIIYFVREFNAYVQFMWARETNKCQFDLNHFKNDPIHRCAWWCIVFRNNVAIFVLKIPIGRNEKLFALNRAHFGSDWIKSFQLRGDIFLICFIRIDMKCVSSTLERTAYSEQTIEILFDPFQHRSHIDFILSFTLFSRFLCNRKLRQ